MDIPAISKISTNLDTNNVQKKYITNQSLSEDSISNSHLKEDTDTLFISEEARNISKEKDPLASTKEGFYTAMELLKNLNETSESREDGFTERLKCIKIALRIIKGDKVPLKDMAFLAEK